MEHVNAETNIQTSFSPDSVSLIVLASNAYLWQSPERKAREEETGYRGGGDRSEGDTGPPPEFRLSRGSLEGSEVRVTYPVFRTRVFLRFYCVYASHYSQRCLSLCGNEHFYYHLRKETGRKWPYRPSILQFGRALKHCLLLRRL